MLEVEMHKNLRYAGYNILLSQKKEDLEELIVKVKT